MSLKIFHGFFILVSVVLFVGLGVWLIEINGPTRIALGFASLGTSLGLLYYGYRFIKKMKGVQYPNGS